MKDSITRELYVIVLTDDGVQCAVDATSKDAFWLPRKSQVTWKSPPVVGKPVEVMIPGWLASKHRQLAGDEAFEKAKNRERMSDGKAALPRTTRDMYGSLSKNARKEKDTHPDYKGSIVIDGQKYWLDGWIKDSQDGVGKYLSLSAKVAE